MQDKSDLRPESAAPVSIQKQGAEPGQKGSTASSVIKSDPKIKAYGMASYLNEKMMQDAIAFRESGTIKTGYSNVDALTNLYPGLYVLGAISSLGKTTFVHQMADQMAQAGQAVLFFSLEQSILEMAGKSLSRVMARHDASTAMTSLQIRKNPQDPRVAKAATEYATYAANLTIVECTFRADIDTIASVVASYIQQTGKKPVVIVDYLQVIQPAEGSRLSTKDLTDYHVRRLKQIQVDYAVPVIVISSLNRQNYLALIEFESFKESGGIEYTADVIWGLQLQCLHDSIFENQSRLNEKREIIRKAKAAIPRKVELVCLKNRFGISSYTCNFNYYPHCDLFIPSDYASTGQGSPTPVTSDPDGFTRAEDAGFDFEGNPFI